MTYLGYRLQCDYPAREAIRQIVIWVLLCFITLGLAVFILPYYFVGALINRTTLVDAGGHPAARLHADVIFGDILGHALLWLVLTVVTFGLAYIVFWPAAIKRVLDSVQLSDH